MEEHFGFSPDPINRENDDTKKFPDPGHFKKKFPKDQKKKIAMRKEIRKKKQERKKRIIIRNLSFKVDEKMLKKEFLQFGNIVDVSIPKKPDGKMRGFAFIQYECFQSAIKAIRNLNYKKLIGRPIAVDYAIAKDKYQHITSSKHITNPGKRSKETSEIQMNEDEESLVEKEDSDEDSQCHFEDNAAESLSETDNDHVKEFLKEFDADRESLQNDDEPEEDDHSTSGSSSESDDDSKDFKRVEDSDGDEDDMEDDDTEISSSKRRKIAQNSSQEPLHKKNLSQDVNEGKTIFIRNVPFDADQDALKRTMEVFGTVKYCLLCIDRFTELPRGTAFVKFENKEDANKVIEKSSDTDAEGIYLDGRKLSCTLAISQEELQTKADSNVKIGKDKRNLYLLKEGLIRSGSVESQGVSQSDLAMRGKLEILKRNKLKNFQFFVSDKRLCIHNIPPNYNDTKLLKLFKSAAGPGANVTEAKIIRDLKKFNPQGITKSKGFGFVAFDKHDDALKALKDINNNPDVFTSQKRPIVEFAVENLNALLTKQRRQEKSRMKIKKELENSESNHPEEEDLMSLKFRKKQNHNKKSGKTEIVRMMPINNNSANNNQQRKRKSNKNKMGNKFSGQKKSQFRAEDESIATGNNNNRFSKERLQKKKIGNKLNGPRKPQFKEAHTKDNKSDMSPLKQKKKKNKQQKMKGKSAQGIDSSNFSQMVNNYKQKLLSKM